MPIVWLQKGTEINQILNPHSLFNSMFLLLFHLILPNLSFSQLRILTDPAPNISSRSFFPLTAVHKVFPEFNSRWSGSYFKSIVLFSGFPSKGINFLIFILHCFKDLN